MPNYRRLFIPNTYIFLTITTNYRSPILVNNIELLRESFKRAKLTYKYILFASVILPEHMHLIIKPEKVEEYPKIMRAIKYNFTQMINAGGIAIPPYEVDQCRSGLLSRQQIWQKRYYEHTIKDEEDLNNHLNYVHYNPIKHGHAKNVKDWEFSSFHKFIESKIYDNNWGTSSDIEKIANLEYE